MNQERIQALREQIDAIDNQLVELLDQRLQCSVLIGREKQVDHKPMYDEAREKMILDKVDTLLEGSEYREEVHQLYRFLLDLSKRTQFKHISK